jgi:uncharacterized membrane protein
MYRWPTRASAVLLLAGVVVLGIGAAVPAQEVQVTAESAEVQILAPYVGIAVKPGDTASFSIQVHAPAGDELALATAGVPDGWTAEIRGGGLVVDRVMVDDSLTHNLKLDVDVPSTAAEGSYQIGLVATGANSSDRLDFDITVAQTAGGSVSLDTEFPALRGPSDVKFTFNLDLKNDTGDDVQFGLDTQGPDGWQVDAKPSGQSRASTVTVGAGSSERITVEVDPPDSTPAGAYPVVVRASGSGESATADLAVEITGNFDMTLVPADERLNVDVQAGKATEMPLVVANGGTAPLHDVALSATPPRGWKVTFTPDTVSDIEPGATADVVATITPADDAIAGDYRLTIRSQVAETNDSIEVRATVKTSAVWGLVGVAIILIALGALGFVFRRFGRR